MLRKEVHFLSFDSNFNKFTISTYTVDSSPKSVKDFKSKLKSFITTFL